MLMEALAEAKRRLKVRQRASQYNPRGYIAEMFGYQGREFCLSGPAGTGKSRGILELLNRDAWEYHGSRQLIVRKVRADLAQSVLVTFERDVLGEDNPICGNVQREYRQVYRYPNGSEVVVGGMDRPMKVMSAEYDRIYVPEATELSVKEYEPLITRLRSNVMPFQQIVSDCNPDAPDHWLYQRGLSGKLLMRHTTHKDNPLLWDAEKQEWTAFGMEYLAKLGALTGVRRLRLLDGQWVQAEGVVFDGFNPETHVDAKAEYDPALGSVSWYCDDGYAEGQGRGTESYHPRVILLAQETPVGGVNIFAEYYRTQVASYDTSIDEVLTMEYPAPSICRVDSAAAMFRGALYQRGFSAIRATHPVEEGIKNVQRMLSEQVGGVPLLRIHPRCVELIREMGSYRREPGTGRLLKIDDHGPSAVRYGTYHLRWAN